MAGNHDNYDTIPNYPHYLGDCGFHTLNGTEFFYLRGAYSIDRDSRTIGVDWWAQEEIPIEKGEPLAIELASFTACVRDRSRPKVSGELGRTALEVAIQVTEQIRAGMARR